MAALERVREVLKEIGPVRRRAALPSMDPLVQKALLAFLQSPKGTQQTGLSLGSNKSTEQCPIAACASSTISSSLMRKNVKPVLNCKLVTDTSPRGNAGAKIINCVGTSKYKAIMHIKALRFYTQARTDVEVAIEHYIILVQIRNAIAEATAADLDIWSKPEHIYAVCRVIFDQHGTSESEIGLGAMLHFRAPRWLRSDVQIISPVMPLEHALKMHSRILQTRDVSWEAFRREWIALLQCGYYKQHRRLSLAAAEAMVDVERQRGLDSKWNKTLEQAVRRAAASLQHDKRQGLKLGKAAVQKQRDVAKAEKLRTQRKKERWKWLRTSAKDLTTAEIMGGFPAHLRDI